MTTISDLIAESRQIVFEVMQAEGELTEEQEERLATLMQQKQHKAKWLQALYKRCKSESELYAEEIKALQSRRKRAESTANWSRLMMLEILKARIEAGEESKIPHVCHLMKTKTVKHPDRVEDWPKEFIIDGTPKLDKSAIKKAISAGQVVDGCELVEVQSVVIK